MMKYEDFDTNQYKTELVAIFDEIEASEKWSRKRMRKILGRYPKDGKGIFSKDMLVRAYRQLVKEKQRSHNPLVMKRIRMKPTRTISGVAPVTVLTKPFPCPGKCIYCPNDVRMPKSYLKDEPGAQRAERNAFDPYLQTYNRLLAFKNTGHSTDKIELIVLGGTWSFYPETYQIWFIKRCFDAMNDFKRSDKREEIKTQNDFEEAERIPRKAENGRNRSYNEIVTEVVRNKGKQFISESETAEWEELLQAQTENETAKSRCVGLVIETRPDYIDEAEIIKIRKLGATKVQIGVQSLDDRIQKLNKRGHGIEETRKAFKLLREAAFKIHAHWMPNQLGATVVGDIEDYGRLWEKDFRPDELKIYPTSIIANTELSRLHEQGKYEPYGYDELLKVLTKTMQQTPRYCRLTRVIRDIPAQDIVAGNRLSNFRQIAEEQMKNEGKYCQCIRCREIKGQEITQADVEMEIIDYETSIGTEKFISVKTKTEDKIVAFLRLALPEKPAENFIEELKDAAMIREVHVYGQVVGIGKKGEGRSQHLGLGSQLVNKAKQLAVEAGFEKLAVISAIGTREYYRKHGFEREGLYMTTQLPQLGS